MLDLQRRYRLNPGAVKADELLCLIQDWFANHILGTDMELKPFIAGKD